MHVQLNIVYDTACYIHVVNDPVKNKNVLKNVYAILAEIFVIQTIFK